MKAHAAVFFWRKLDSPGHDSCRFFTPATNLLALRRLALAVGEEAQAPAAYLAFPSMHFKLLPQRYKRLSRTEYDYESPSFGYRGTLRVSPIGAVLEYPGLFQAVPSK